MKILVITPHPDDEVLGCGGAIKRHAENGDEVYLCIVTKAYTPDWTEKFIEDRKEEIECANNILGIKKTFFLDLPTAKLDTVGQKKINDLLSDCVGNIKPDIVYIPHGGDLNIDHRLIFESSLVALRPKHGNKVNKIMSYEILSETEWGSSLADNLSKVFIPNVYIDITEVLKYKIKAMSCYKSELKKYPHPRSEKAINALAEKRGSEAGFNAAEAFMLIRELI